MESDLHGQHERYSPTAKTRTTALIHGPQHPRTRRGPNGPRRPTGVRVVPNMLGLLRDHDGIIGWPSGETFWKWSSRTACNLRQTTNSMRCAEQLMYARRAAWLRRVMWFSRPTRARRFARLMRKMWSQQLRHGKRKIALRHGPRDIHATRGPN